MKTMDIVKAVVVVAALGGAAYMAYRTFGTPDETQEVFTTAKQHFRCVKGKHEYTLTAAEVMQISTKNQGMVVCPECSSESMEGVICPSCKKFVELVGHGQVPAKCTLCKAKIGE